LKGLFKLISFMVLLLSFSGAQANLLTTHDLSVHETKAELEIIRLQVLNNTLDYRGLHQAQKKLQALQKKAIRCINKNETSFTEIKLLLDQSKASGILSSDNQNLKFLEKEKQLLLKQIAGCGVIEYKTRNLEKKVNAAMSQVNSNQMLFKKLPVWKHETIPSFFGFAVEVGTLYQVSGIEKLKQHSFIAALIIIILISLIIAYGLYIMFTYLLRKASFSKRILALLKRYLPLLTTLLSLNLFLDWTFQTTIPKPLLVLLVQLLLIFTVIYTFIRINLIALTHKKRWFTERLRRLVIYSITLLLFIVSIGSFASEATKEHILPYTFLNIHPLFYLGVLCLSFLWVIGVGLYIATQRHLYSPAFYWTIKTIAACCFLIIFTASWFDYDYFAIFFIHNLILTTFVLLMVWQGSYLLGKIYHTLHDISHPISKKIHTLLGGSKKKNLIEFFILRVLLTAGLIFRALLFLSLRWGMPRYYIDILITYLTEGFNVLGVSIHVVKTLRGLFVFCVIVMLGRLIGATVARSHSFAHRENAQNTIVTLINYVAFILGMFVLFVVAGGSLGGLALIAGALSVGIGFGLKGIAADLISGLILLLSKSIRPGDHIVIDQTEGFVQKIRILSTEVKTLSKSNVMIPNALFLGTSVTNYTYKDKLSRVTCQVMLKDINDLERARNILIEVALQHADVIKKDKNKPEVLIELKPARATLDVLLTLWCVIKDVDERYRVSSDINFDVLQAFKAAKIELKIA
jgi:potassium-dependent mechanosensitive channel